MSHGLTLDEVRAHMRALPFPVVQELAQGPLRDLEPGDEGYTLARDCRVCNALGPITVDPKGKDMRLPYGLTAPHPAAVVLEEWHDCIGTSFELARLAAELELPAPLNREVIEVAGWLSYARCCMVYFAAQLLVQEHEYESALEDVDVLFSGSGPYLTFVEVHKAGTREAIAVGRWTKNDEYPALRLSVNTSGSGVSSGQALPKPLREEVRPEGDGGSPQSPEGARP